MVAVGRGDCSICQAVRDLIGGCLEACTAKRTSLCNLLLGERRPAVAAGHSGQRAIAEALDEIRAARGSMVE